MKALTGRLGMSLELLRSKTFRALDKLGASLPSGAHTEEHVQIVYVSPAGEETEISLDHFRDDARCHAGTYRVFFGGQLSGEGKLLDPSAVHAERETTASGAIGKLVSSLMLTAENNVDNANRREAEAYQRERETRHLLDQQVQRVMQLEQLAHQLTIRNAELERGTGGDAGLRELSDVLMLLVREWIGGGQWSPEKVKAVARLVSLVPRSERLQAAVREEAGAELLDALVRAS